jgi:serine/threonine protein kinase
MIAQKISQTGATPISQSGPTYRSELLDAAYEEYLSRRARGEQVDPDQFCAAFPSMKSSLGRLLRFDAFLQGHEPLLENWPAPGDKYAGFVLLHQLGQGAFARVYLARDERLGGRLVVLKVSRHGGPEANILGRIQHPNVVPVYSIQDDEPTGLCAVCMPYLGSATLDDVLDRLQGEQYFPERARFILDSAEGLPMPLDPSAEPGAPDVNLLSGAYVEGIRWIGARLAGALAFLHNLGICHRDLKPSNVLMQPNGTPVLLDFNLCTDQNADDVPFGGTLVYMAPEQLTSFPSEPGHAKSGPQADLFSLGVLLYQLATGQHPFDPLSLALKTPELRALLLERQKGGARPACELNPRIDRAFSDLIQQCLAFDPKDRPESAAHLAALLHDGLPKPAESTRLARTNLRGWLEPVMHL